MELNDGAYALLGVALGAGFSYLREWAAVARTSSFARQERIRQDRIGAYSDLASSLIEYRRVQLGYWHAKQAGEGRDEAATEARRARGAAWQAFYRVELLADDEHLSTLAKGALDQTSEMDEARSQDDLSVRGEAVRAAVDEFVRAAAAQTVRQGGPGRRPRERA